MPAKWFRPLASLLGLGLIVALVTIPASGKATFKQIGAKKLNHLSGAPALRYYMAHPELAPAGLRSRFEAIRSIKRTGYRSNATLAPPAGDRLNFDDTGLPQNEESVTVCKGNTNYVLEGTNDYRGLLDPEGNFTGWHWSNDGGANLDNEGLLPHVTLSDTTTRPSGGDPVDVCTTVNNAPTLYAASLNYDPSDPTGSTSAIGLYKTTPGTLNTCPGGADPSCWPNTKVVAESAPNHFLDKEWMDVGNTGDGVHVWVTYTDFDNSLPCCYANIMAVRCAADLSSCGTPIQIDDPTVDDDVQFSDVTIGPDHRTYITYVQVIGEIEGTAQTFVVKARIGAASCGGASCFGPIRTVDSVDNALGFGAFLQADDFRIATVPKNTVKTVNGDPRIFVVYDECKSRVLEGTVCEQPKAEMRWSDDDGVTWSGLITLSKTGVDRVDYFPSVVNDTTDGKIVVAYFTNRFNNEYQNAQDIEMVTVDAATATIVKRQTVTTDVLMPNEPEADPLLSGFFIGDYIEVAAHAGTAYIGYNMNIRKVQLLFDGELVRQQDNFLTKVTE